MFTTTIRYTYDPLQRLTGATTYTFAYAYDPVGNRTAQTQTPSATPTASTLVTNYVYDAANPLTSVNRLAYTWDNNPAPLRYGDSRRSWQPEE